MKKILWLFLASLLLLMIPAVWLISDENIKFIDSGWEYRWSDEDTWKPANKRLFYNQDHQRLLWLRVDLPAAESKRQVMQIGSIRQNFEMVIDNQIIYKVGEMPASEATARRGWFPAHIVDLPEGSAGKKVTFKIGSAIESVGISGIIRTGPLTSIIRERARYDAPKIISGTLCSFAGLVALLLFLRNRKEKGYAAFAGTALNTAIIVATGSFAFQLVVTDPVLVFYLFHFAAFTWQYFWVTFLCTLMDENQTKIAERMQKVNLVVSAAGVLLLFVKPTTAEITLAFFLMLMLFNFGMMAFLFRKRIGTDLEAQIYGVGSLLWVITSTHDALYVFGVFQAHTAISSAGQFADVMAQATILLLRFNRINLKLKAYSQEVDDQKKNLEELNSNLEKEVQARTKDLLEQKAVFEQLFTNSPDGILIINGTQKIVSMNQAFEIMFDYKQTETAGKKIADIFPPSNGTEQPGTLPQDIFTGLIKRTETKLRHRNGQSIPVSISSYPYTHDQEEDKERPGLFMVIADLRERKKMEQLLHIAYQQQRKNQFMRDITATQAKWNDEMQIQGRHLGLIIPKQFSLMRIQITSEGEELTNADYDEILEILQQEPGTIAWDNGRDVGVLMQVKKDVTYAEEIVFAERFEKTLKRKFSKREINIGIAEYLTGIKSIAKRWKQTQESIVVGRMANSEKRIHHYLDNGVFQILTSLTENEEADDYIERMIGRLLRYDQDNNSELVMTLEKILSTQNLKIAAEELFLHHKTAVQRKHRIESILNCSLDDFAVKLNLGLALQLLRLRKEKGGND